MRFFIDLILFLCLFVKHSSSNYILCTSQCTQITASFFQPLSIPVDCQQNNITNIYDYALVCIVDYRIDYSSKHIYISFKSSNDTNIYKEQNQSEFLTQTIWLGFNEESNQPNITDRKYVCNTKDDCARQFYLNTIERLIIDGQLQFDEINSKLYNHSKSARPRCRDTTKIGNRSTTRCRNGLCYVYNIGEKQHCASDNTPTLFSEIEYHSPKLITNEREVIEYKCNTELCNRNGMIKIIQNILLNYTNWNNKNKIEENQLKEKSSTIQRTVSYCLIILSLINLQFLF